MSVIVQFRPAERVRIDPCCLQSLCARLGTRVAEQILADSMEEIAARLCEMERHMRQDEMAHLAEIARKLQHLAVEVGFVSLARVSRDLAINALRDDKPAMAAVWARMLRVGDKSMAMVWELPGLSL